MSADQQAASKQPKPSNQQRAEVLRGPRPLLRWKARIMFDRYAGAIPERMVVLTILPPPSPAAPLRPFGYGAFIVEATARRGQPRFAAHSHGFAAGCDAAKLRASLRRVIAPEAITLIHLPAELAARSPAHAVDRILEHVPRAGSRRTIVSMMSRDVLHHAAGIAQLYVGALQPTPLARLLRIDAEAQAAWVHWLFVHRDVRHRRDLLAAHAAWQQVDRAKRRVRLV